MIDEQTLILYYYEDELSADTRAQIAAAMASEPALAQRYGALRARLERLRTLTPAAPDARVSERWHAQIEAAAQVGYAAEATVPPRRFAPTLWAAAAALVLAVGIGVGTQFWGDAGPPPTPLAEDRPPPPTPLPVVDHTSFERALTVHFTQSKLTLARLPESSGEQRDELLEQIIEQNRLYKLAAERNGADRLARVLRAFEPVLLQLADEQAAQPNRDELRDQLTFELDAMLTKLGHDASDYSKSF